MRNARVTPAAARHDGHEHIQTEAQALLLASNCSVLVAMPSCSDSKQRRSLIAHCFTPGYGEDTHGEAVGVGGTGSDETEHSD